MKIKLIKNFLHINDFTEINKKVLEPRWGFNHSSNNSEEESFFWKLDLNEKEDPYFFTTLYDKIKNVTEDDFYIERVYFNGHNACSSGNIHKDNPSENAKTFLVYCNQAWHPKLGGGTSFVKGMQDIITIYPYPGSAVYFDGYIPHGAQPISKDFKGTRISLAYKLIRR